MSGADLKFTAGKFEGMKVCECPTWYLEFVVRSGYLFKTSEWRAAKDELRKRSE